MSAPEKRKKKPHPSARSRRAAFPRCRAWMHEDHLEVVVSDKDEFAFLALVTDNLVLRHPSLCFASVTFTVDRFGAHSYFDVTFRLQDSDEVLHDVEAWVNGAKGRGEAGRLLAARTREARKLKELSKGLPHLTPATAVIVDLDLDCLDCPGIFRPICTKVAAQACSFESITARTTRATGRAPEFHLKAEVLCPDERSADELINHLRAACQRFPMAVPSVERRRHGATMSEAG